MSYTNFNNYGVQKDGDEYRLVSNTIPVKYFKLGNKPDGVITAGVFTIDEDTSLVTFTSPFIYRINGTEHTPMQTTLQLNAWDDDFVRIDAIYGKTDGTYDFIDGNAGNDYLLPTIPEGTVLIGAIQRGVLFPRQNIVAINSFIGDLPKIGGSVFGDITVLNGSNFIRRAIAGTSDSGDDIYQDGDGNEIFRTFHYDGKIFVRIANDTTREYEVVTSDSVVSFVISDTTISTETTYSSSKLDADLALKADKVEIKEDVIIAFGDPNLSGNNYTNIELADKTVQLAYTNNSGPQLPYVTFNSSGVGVLPDIPESGNPNSNITIRGTSLGADYASKTYTNKYKKDPLVDYINLLTQAEARFLTATGSIGTPNWTPIDNTPTISLQNNAMRVVFTAGLLQSVKIMRAVLMAATTDYYIHIRARLISGTTCDVEVGGFASAKGNGNFIIRPTANWQIFTAKVRTTSANRMCVGILAADNTGATFEFTDIVLSASPLSNEITPPNNDGLTQSSANLKLLACILRPAFPVGATGGEQIPWSILAVSEHKPLVVTAVDSSGLGNKLVITYPEANFVVNLHVNTDDGFSAFNLVAGASVGVDHADIYAYKKSNIGKIVAWNTANNRLGAGEGTVTSDNCIAVATSNISNGGRIAEAMQPNNDSSATRLEYAGSNNYIVRPYAINPISGSKKFKVINLTTGLEVDLTTLITAQDIFYLVGGTSSQIIPMSVVSSDADIRNMQSIVMGAGTNWWVSGIMEY